MWICVIFIYYINMNNYLSTIEMLIFDFRVLAPTSLGMSCNKYVSFYLSKIQIILT